MFVLNNRFVTASHSTKDTQKNNSEFVEDGTNKLIVKCKYCGSKILDRKAGKFVTDEINLPLMLQEKSPDSQVQYEKINQFYFVDNMYTFENIGFTHTIDNCKYLSCADCDAGPIGSLELLLQKLEAPAPFPDVVDVENLPPRTPLRQMAPETPQSSAPRQEQTNDHTKKILQHVLQNEEYQLAKSCLIRTTLSRMPPGPRDCYEDVSQMQQVVPRGVRGWLVFGNNGTDNIKNMRSCILFALFALFALVCVGASETHSRFPRQYFGGKPERPRPFEPASYLPPVTGYPAAGSRPTPTYSEGPSPTYSPFQPSTPFQPSPDQPAQPPYPTSFQPDSPTIPAYQPSPTPEEPSEQPFKPSPTYFPNQPSQPANTNQPETDEPNFFTPSQTSPSQPNQPERPDETPIPNEPQQTVEPENPQGNGPQITPVTPDDDDDRHPPHIHAISVDCGKEMMTINIEFNKPYNGIIYSQDHFKENDCVYVRANSNRAKYSFTVSLNTCGTRFFSDFENEGQAYLENVLVLQNEPGIQEVWDHIRRVRCLWEGNLTKQLVSSLSVGMLNQITSNFSGDTAMARLDIQTGKGPFAPEANGLIKIGEIMTLVVSVTGDAGFDILVRECIARDADNNNVVPLTDSNGCVLKPKLFGAFQKTRDTGNTGASIIAYAYFNAFKFPDEMDLIIQCEVELCKTDCDVCPNPGSTDPRRKRRDVIHVGNRTMEPVTTIGKGLRVVFAEDLPIEPDFCMSPSTAMWGSVLVLSASLLSSVIVSYCWQKSRGIVKFS
ncbi:unnamed protein product [Leptosia nina]|uniref:ZP domain-containing protein n=1 Tax=Leptosia nina TaxID=320188 RepID=A0AAV1J589_9NEOP